MAYFRNAQKWPFQATHIICLALDFKILLRNCYAEEKNPVFYAGCEKYLPHSYVSNVSQALKEYAKLICRCLEISLRISHATDH